MSLYNVVAPCVVGKSHHVRPTTAPIEVDDAVAAPLVEAGKLTSISAASSEHPLGWPDDAQPRDSGPYAEAGEQAGHSFAEGVVRTAEDFGGSDFEPLTEEVETAPPNPEPGASRARRPRRPRSED